MRWFLCWGLSQVSKLLIFLLIFSGSVFADTYPATSTMVYRSSGYGHDGVNYSSLLAVCASISNSQNRYTSGSNGISCAYSYYADGSNKSYGPVDNNNPMQVITSYDCSNGGTVSGSTCINAPACPAPQTRDSITGACTAPAVICTSSQYNDTLTTCAKIPDCNSSSSTGGNYFNTTTKVCVNDPNITLCIGAGADGGTDKFCPPINDCKPSTYICSNNDSIVLTDSSTSPAQVAAKAASKLQADNTTSEISNIELQAKAQADSKIASAAAAKQAKDLANTQFQSATTAGVQAAKDAASLAYSTASQAYIDAVARMTNSSSAAAAAAAVKVLAQAFDDQIPASNPGNSEALNKKITPLLSSAIKALQDSQNGTGNGSGNGTGQPTLSSPTTDVSGLNKESTQAGIKSAIEKLGSGKTVGGLAPLPDSYYTKKFPDGFSQVWTAHKSAFLQTGFVQSVYSLTPSIGSGGACPSWDFTVWRLGTQTLTMPCIVWPFLRVFFIISSLFLARRLIFGG